MAYIECIFDYLTSQSDTAKAKKQKASAKLVCTGALYIAPNCTNPKYLSQHGYLTDNCYMKGGGRGAKINMAMAYVLLNKIKNFDLINGVDNTLADLCAYNSAALHCLDKSILRSSQL